MEQDHTRVALRWIQENKKEQLPESGAVLVRHDVWCASWYNKLCDCHPEIYPANQPSDSAKPIVYPVELLRNL
jgi:hypothetical protein